MAYAASSLCNACSYSVHRIRHSHRLIRRATGDKPKGIRMEQATVLSDAEDAHRDGRVLHFQERLEQRDGAHALEILRQRHDVTELHGWRGFTSKQQLAERQEQLKLLVTERS
eukprot:3155382-Prymnesium_polylepis.2